jgi:plastocyanin
MLKNSLLLLMLSVVLSGCGGVASTRSMPTATSTAPPVVSIQPLVLATPLSTPTTRVLPANHVDVGDNFFYPRIITVTVDTKIRWTNVGAANHDVTAMDRSWGGRNLGMTESYEESFSREGVHDYECVAHRPGQRGKVVVIAK